jgi:hypothetical protein
MVIFSVKVFAFPSGAEGIPWTQALPFDGSRAAVVSRE